MEYQFTLSALTLEPVSIGIGAAAGFFVACALLAGWILSLSQKRAGLQARLDAQAAAQDEHFRALAQQILSSNSESFLNMAQEKLKSAQNDVRHDLDKRTQSISSMVKPVETVLAQLKGAVDQLQGTGTVIREDMQNLARETARLTGALKNPAAQGKWGEFVLERLLDKANLIKGIHYDTQVTIQGEESRLRPDVVISLQDGFHIIVDSKAPITEFITRLEEDLTDAQRADIQLNLARSVRGHVKALSARGYWQQAGSPDFVVLFLPSEHLFSTVLIADPGIVDYAAEHQVVIASPTLMLSLLRVVALSWRQVELAKNAQGIAQLGGELFDRVTSFAGHLDKVGKGIEGALGAYNKAASVLETRVLVSARKLRELQGVAGHSDIESPRLVESAARPISLSDTDETPEDDRKKYG
jgi:DNA recombination protein RmuC